MRTRESFWSFDRERLVRGGVERGETSSSLPRITESLGLWSIEWRRGELGWTLEDASEIGGERGEIGSNVIEVKAAVVLLRESLFSLLLREGTTGFQWDFSLWEESWEDGSKEGLDGDDPKGSGEEGEDEVKRIESEKIVREGVGVERVGRTGLSRTGEGPWKGAGSRRVLKTLLLRAVTASGSWEGDGVDVERDGSSGFFLEAARLMANVYLWRFFLCSERISSSVCVDLPSDCV